MSRLCYPHSPGSLDKDGYRLIYVNGVKIPEHRYVMENYIERKLQAFPYEIVHHKNGKKLDNRIENLELLSQGEHNINHLRKSIIVKNLKLCTRCHKFLPLDKFSRNKYHKLGLLSCCKTCQNIMNQIRLRRLRKIEEV